MKIYALIVVSVLLSACEQKTSTIEAPAVTPKVEAVIKPRTPTPEPRFTDIVIRPEWTARLDRVVSGIVRDKDRYLVIQNMRTNGMPWFIIGSIHERESSRNFTRHLHEGSPLLYRTRDIPQGRLPLPAQPPFTFSQSAEDALYVLKSEQKVNWNEVKSAVYAIIAYNGLGYMKYHPEVQSPYAYSGTTKYERGKYVADGRFSSTAIDQQPGVIALWVRMQQRNLLND